MTHQPLDGNLALPSLSIYNAQRYTFLKKRKNMLLVMAVHAGIWCWGTLVCPVSLATSRWQCSECSIYSKVIYGALNSCCVRASRHASDSVITVVSGFFTIGNKMRSQTTGKGIILAKKEVVH